METIIPFIIPVIVAFCISYRHMKRKQEEEEEQELAEEYRTRQYDDAVNLIYETAQESAKQTQEQLIDSMKEEQENEPDTIGLMFRTLSNIGCQPKKDDDGTIRVAYQGENFHMEFFGRYVRIWDPMWAAIKADDPNMPKIREAINAANYYFGTTVVLDHPNEKGIIAFHTINDIMLHPACPDNEPFVKAVLDSFFDVKEQVRSNFQQINAKQMEAQKSCRPVGFTTNTDSNE